MTPTSLTPTELALLMRALHRYFVSHDITSKADRDNITSAALRHCKAGITNERALFNTLERMQSESSGVPPTARDPVLFVARPPKCYQAQTQFK